MSTILDMKMTSNFPEQSSECTFLLPMTSFILKLTIYLIANFVSFHIHLKPILLLDTPNTQILKENEHIKIKN